MKNRKPKVEESSNVSVLSEKYLDCKEIGLKGVADKLVIANGEMRFSYPLFWRKFGSDVLAPGSIRFTSPAGIP